jgi:hypothetical protein
MILRPLAVIACAAAAVTALGGCSREMQGAIAGVSLLVPCGAAQRQAMEVLRDGEGEPGASHNYADAVAPLDHAKQVCQRAAGRIRSESLLGPRSREFAEAMDVQAVGLGEMADSFRRSPNTPPSRNIGFQTGLGHVREGLQMLRQLRSGASADGPDDGAWSADGGDDASRKS